MTKLLTISRAAHQLGCAESTVRRWADSGRLPIAARLPDGSRLFLERDVLALVALRARPHDVGR